MERIRTLSRPHDRPRVRSGNKPRYAIVVFDIKMYGSVSLLCIFDNCRLAITRGLRWMDGRMERDGWRERDGEGCMDESRDG